PYPSGVGNFAEVTLTAVCISLKAFTDIIKEDCGMASELMAWLPHSPFRSPAWRWARACWLAGRAAPLAQRSEEEWGARAHSFMRAADRSRCPDGQPQWSEHDFAIQQALGLSCEEQPYRRWHVEALLLTSEPLEGVSSRTALPVLVIAAFHA